MFVISFWDFDRCRHSMTKLIFCVITMLISVNDAGRAQETEKINFPSNFLLQNIPRYEDCITNEFKIFLLQVAKNQSKKSTINVVLSDSSCPICDGIFGELMKVSAQTFLTVDFASTDDSNTKQNTGIASSVGYYKSLTFLMNNVGEFLEKFAKLRLKYAWNPRAQHLIFTVIQPTIGELEMMFNECWTHRVLNVAVMVYNREQAYTYNPYHKDRLQVEEVVDWSGMFYDKLRNTNGRLIKAKYIPYSADNVVKWVEKERRFEIFARDFGYANAFYKAMNATPGFINLTQSHILLYKNFSHLNEIWTNHEFEGFELWLNYLPDFVTFEKRIEHSYPVLRDDVRIVVPKSGIKTPSLLEPFDQVTWICVLITLVVFSGYLYIFNKLRGIIENALFRTLSVFLGMGMANRRQELVQKFTFTMLTMFSLLILNAYQGSLYSALAIVSHYPEINTLTQLYQRTRTVHTVLNVAMFLRESEPGLRVLPFDDIEYNAFMESHRHEAYAFPNSMAELAVRRKPLSENGVPFYHIMKEYSLPGFVGYTFPYGSPYLDKLDRVVLACKEAGLDEYWAAEAVLQDTLSGMAVKYIADEKPLRRLSLQTQKMAFYIVGVGQFVSLCCFVAELYWHGQLDTSRKRRYDLQLVAVDA